jgi:hypothetical protein
LPECRQGVYAIVPRRCSSESTPGDLANPRDPYRLRAAPDSELVQAAATLAKGLVSIESCEPKPQRAAAVGVLDNAGREIGNELRSRQAGRTIDRQRNVSETSG